MPNSAPEERCSLGSVAVGATCCGPLTEWHIISWKEALHGLSAQSTQQMLLPGPKNGSYFNNSGMKGFQDELELEGFVFVGACGGYLSRPLRITPLRALAPQRGPEAGS